MFDSAVASSTVMLVQMGGGGILLGWGEGAERRGRGVANGKWELAMECRNGQDLERYGSKPPERQRC